MTVTLGTRHDLTLPAFRRVAWEGEPVVLGPAVPARLAASRAAFLSLLEDESATVYGVTSGFGDRATLRLSPRGAGGAGAGGERSRRLVRRGAARARDPRDRLRKAREPASTAMPRCGRRWRRRWPAMLAGAELPRVPSQGNGGSGEILALGHLFDSMGRRLGSGGEGGQRARQRLAVRRCPARRRRARCGGPGDARRTRRSRSRSRRLPRRSRPTTPCSPGLWGDDGETTALQRLGALAERCAERARWSPGSGQLPHPPARARPGRAGARGCADAARPRRSRP